jgi:hypothetical protein
MIGVKGWYSANWRKPWPILAAGTMALLRKGSRISGTMAIPADWGVLAAMPSATVSQAAAKAVAAMIPIAASQSSGVAGDRKPRAKAMPMMTATAIMVDSIVASTCPVRTAPRETFMTLNRLMMPVVMSVFTDTAVAPRP